MSGSGETLLHPLPQIPPVEDLGDAGLKKNIASEDAPTGANIRVIQFPVQICRVMTIRLRVGIVENWIIVGHRQLLSGVSDFALIQEGSQRYLDATGLISGVAAVFRRKGDFFRDEGGTVEREET